MVSMRITADAFLPPQDMGRAGRGSQSGESGKMGVYLKPIPLDVF